MSRHCHPQTADRAAPKRPSARGPDAAIVIAGASFAGLAAARALRGHDIVIVEQHPIGAFETSAGGMPLSVLQALDASDAVRETHHDLVLHTPRAERSVPLPTAYAVADYALLCQRLAAQADAQVLRRRATGYRNGVVLTDQGTIACLAAIDATGHRAVLASSVNPGYAPRSAMGAAVEVVLHRPHGFPNGLHIYLGPDWPPGYGWAFGAGDTLRVGVGLLSANRHARHLDAALRAVLARAGLRRAGEPLTRHGGLIPLHPRGPIVDDLFVVGDAAGQALPGTAEGIRPALHFGTRLGAALADALDGRTTLAGARRVYREHVTTEAHAYRPLAYAQRLLLALPPAIAATLVATLARSDLTSTALDRYAHALAVPTAPLPRGADEAPHRAVRKPTRGRGTERGTAHLDRAGRAGGRRLAGERNGHP